MLIESITNSKEYREAREELKEAAAVAGWKRIKEDFEIENHRKRFFHVVECYLNAPLFLKRETERWLYFDIVTRRACRCLPQIKIEKVIYNEVRSGMLRSPLYISIQNELCIRGAKFFNGNLDVCNTTQILIAKQKKLVNLNIALKFIFTGGYSGKDTWAGAWAESHLKADDALYERKFTASSLTGNHWEDFYVVVTPVDTKAEIRHICHGKKILRWDTTDRY